MAESGESRRRRAETVCRPCEWRNAPRMRPASPSACWDLESSLGFSGRHPPALFPDAFLSASRMRRFLRTFPLPRRETGGLQYNGLGSLSLQTLMHAPELDLQRLAELTSFSAMAFKGVVRVGALEMPQVREPA